jgi:hypothetical protein
VRRIGALTLALAGFLVLSACCAPDRCYVAQSRFEVLEPVTSQLQSFEAMHGRFPASLEEAFPGGLPEGIKPVEGRTGYYSFAKDSGSFSGFSYGKFGGLGDPRDEATIEFIYVGGGLLGGMNVCTWTETKRIWACFGYM